MHLILLTNKRFHPAHTHFKEQALHLALSDMYLIFDVAYFTHNLLRSHLKLSILMQFTSEEEVMNAVCIFYNLITVCT